MKHSLLNLKYVNIFRNIQFISLNNSEIINNEEYIRFSCLISWTALRCEAHVEFRRFSDVDVLAGKGIIGHDPESRGADRNGFRFTLVGTPVRFSRHDGTWSTETSFLDESARRKSVNLVEIVPFSSFSPSFLFFLTTGTSDSFPSNLLLALDIKTDWWMRRNISFFLSGLVGACVYLIM